MVAIWTPEERQLIAELAVGIARMVESVMGKTHDNDPVGPGCVWHGAQSAFETGCDVLWRLGVAHGAKPPESRRSRLKRRRNQSTHETIVEGEAFPTFFRFLPASEIRDLLAGTEQPESLIRETSRPIPSRDEVLPAYVGLACYYGSLSRSQERFTPEQEFAREVDALVSSGYMERRGLTVIWTDKITLAMYEAYIWMDEPPPDAPESYWDDVKAVLETMPEDVKTLLAPEAKRLSEIDFTAFLRDQFDEIYWRKYLDGTPRPRSNSNLSKAVYHFLRAL